MNPSHDNALVARFGTHSDAENAIKELSKSGFPMKQLSIIGKDFHPEEHVVGYYNTGDRMKTWGKFGAFWGAVWGWLVGSAFFVIPGVGPVAVAGPLVAWIVGALEGATVGAGLGALGGALTNIGIPKDSVIRYEQALKAEEFLVIAHGTGEEVERARGIISAASGESVNIDAHVLREPKTA